MDEIKQKITVEADDAVRNTERVAQAEDKLADSTRKVSDEAQKASPAATRLSNIFASMAGGVKSLVTGIVGVGGLVAAFRLAGREMEENTRLARELAQAQIDLSFLSGGNSAADLSIVKQAAEISGRSQIEVSGTFAQFKSQTANLSDQERLGFFQQLIETSLTTSAAPTQLVELFSKGSQFVSDPQKLQNILAQTIIESPESNPAVLARLLPRVLPIGAAAGLQPEVTAGLLSFSAGAAGSAEEGATGLRNIIATLQGRGTPEGQKLLNSLGATSDQGVIQQLRLLSGAFNDGQIGLPEVEALGGRENLALFSRLLGGLGDAESTVGRVAGAARGEKDITRDTLEKIFADDERQRLDLLARQAESRVESLRANDTESQRIQLVRTLVEEQGFLQEFSPVGRLARDLGLQARAFFGATAEETLKGIHPDVADPVLQRLGGQPSINVTQIGQQYNNGDPLEQVRVREQIE